MRIALLTALVLAGCLIATITVGAVKLWPAVKNWTEALLTGKGTSVTNEVRQLTSRLDPRIAELRRNGVDGAQISTLLSNPAFERLLNSVTAVPNLAPLVRDGSYLKALHEAGRQNVRNLADLKLDGITSPNVRAATAEVQQALRLGPGGGGAAGTVDPAVVEVLSSNSFQQLSRIGIVERLFSGANRGAQVE